MTQQLFLQIMIVLYSVSSVAGVVLFAHRWKVTHQDYTALRSGARDGLSDKEYQLAVEAARRNRSIAIILSLVFNLYLVVGVISIIRQFELFVLPWQQGVVTVVALVMCNFLEMFIGVVLVRARASLQGEDD